MNSATDNLPAAREAAALASVNGAAVALAGQPDQGRPKIAAAIAEARAKVQPVPKEGVNPQYKARYATADAVIGEALSALADSGLSLVTVDQSVDGWQREGPDRFELVKQMLLLHSSGEWLPVTIRTPVCVHNGRPLDKAAAAADTLSLSYYLRNLLLLPRVDPDDDTAGRDDRPRQQTAPAREPSEAELHRKALRAVHRRLSARGKLWSAALAYPAVGVTPPAGWSDPPAGDDGLAAAEAMATWVSRETCDRILALLAPKSRPAPQRPPAEQPTPAPPEPPATAPASPEHCRAVWNQARASKWKTAVALLSSLGVVVPDEYQEPLSDQAAERMAGWLTAADAKRALLKLADAASAGRAPPPKG